MGEREGGGECDGGVEAVHVPYQVFVGDRSPQERGPDQANQLLQRYRYRAEVFYGRFSKAGESPAGGA